MVSGVCGGINYYRLKMGLLVTVWRGKVRAGGGKRREKWQQADRGNHFKGENQWPTLRRNIPGEFFRHARV